MLAEAKPGDAPSHVCHKLYKVESRSASQYLLGAWKPSCVVKHRVRCHQLRKTRNLRIAAVRNIACVNTKLEDVHVPKQKVNAGRPITGVAWYDKKSQASGCATETGRDCKAFRPQVDEWVILWLRMNIMEMPVIV